MKKRYKILESLPPYGPMYIPIAADGREFYSEGFVIRFYRLDCTEWVANFFPGNTALSEVIELKNTSNLLIVAGGICYLMNPENSTPLSVFGGYLGEVDHLIPWQIDHLIVWRPVAEKSCRSSFKIS